MCSCRSGSNRLASILLVIAEQAELLELTHDAIFVRSLEKKILYWNRAAERLYGWQKEEARGKITHQLLHTVFPKPLPEIQAEVFEKGYWEGELIHRQLTRLRQPPPHSLAMPDLVCPCVALSPRQRLSPSMVHVRRPGRGLADARSRQPASTCIYDSVTGR